MGKILGAIMFVLGCFCAVGTVVCWFAAIWIDDDGLSEKLGLTGFMSMFIAFLLIMVGWMVYEENDY